MSTEAQRNQLEGRHVRTNINKQFQGRHVRNNDYWGKIEYWTSQLQNAIDNNNLSGVDSCHRKLDYFIQQQWDTKISVLER